MAAGVVDGLVGIVLVILEEGGALALSSSPVVTPLLRTRLVTVQTGM